VIQALAALLLAAGLAGLYRAWRGRRLSAPQRRLWTALGWLLLAAGVVLWCSGLSAGVAVAQAMTLAMLLGLAAVAAHATGLRRAAHEGRGREAAQPPVRAANMVVRGARLLGSLVVVPALGLAAGLVWYALVPGNESDRLMGQAIVALLVAAMALVALLASQRPVRLVAGLSVMLVFSLVVAWQ